MSLPAFRTSIDPHDVCLDVLEGRLPLGADPRRALHTLTLAIVERAREAR